MGKTTTSARGMDRSTTGKWGKLQRQHAARKALLLQAFEESLLLWFALALDHDLQQGRDGHGGAFLDRTACVHERLGSGFSLAHCVTFSASSRHSIVRTSDLSGTKFSFGQWFSRRAGSVVKRLTPAGWGTAGFPGKFAIEGSRFLALKWRLRGGEMLPKTHPAMCRKGRDGERDWRLRHAMRVRVKANGQK